MHDALFALSSISKPETRDEAIDKIGYKCFIRMVCRMMGNFSMSIIDIGLKMAGSNFFIICASCGIRGWSRGGSAVNERVIEWFSGGPSWVRSLAAFHW